MLLSLERGSVIRGREKGPGGHGQFRESQKVSVQQRDAFTGDMGLHTGRKYEGGSCKKKEREKARVVEQLFLFFLLNNLQQIFLYI